MQAPASERGARTSKNCLSLHPNPRRSQHPAHALAFFGFTPKHQQRALDTSTTPGRTIHECWQVAVMSIEAGHSALPTGLFRPRARADAGPTYELARKPLLHKQQSEPRSGPPGGFPMALTSTMSPFDSWFSALRQKVSTTDGCRHHSASDRRRFGPAKVALTDLASPAQGRRTHICGCHDSRVSGTGISAFRFQYIHMWSRFVNFSLAEGCGLCRRALQVQSSARSSSFWLSIVQPQ